MVVLFSTMAFAQGTPADAKAMLERTVAAIKADKAKTLDQINRNGFLVGDLYPFCFNLSDGIIVAIGNPTGVQTELPNILALEHWRQNCPVSD
jgi:hypothetical protein